MVVCTPVRQTRVKHLPYLISDHITVSTALLKTLQITTKKRVSFFTTEKAVGTAVCADTLVKAGCSRVLEFSLAWDMPKIHFHFKQRAHLR